MIEQYFEWLRENPTKTDTSRKIIAGLGLTGGGDFTTDRTIDIGATDDSVVVGADGIKVDTQDSLTSTSITKPLSAAKGKALQDTKANKTVTIEAGNGLTGGGDLSANITLAVASANDGIATNADNIQLNTIDALDSTSATKPLSANQGKVLNDKVVQIETNLNTLDNNIKGTNLSIYGRGNFQNMNKGLILVSSKLPHDAKDWNAYSSFIPVKKNMTVKVKSASDNAHYAISFYSYNNFSSFVGGVVGVNVNVVNIYEYTAPSDGYVVVSTCSYFVTTAFNEKWEIYDSNYYSKLRLLVPNDNRYNTNGFITDTGLSLNNADGRRSDFIQVAEGEYVTAFASCSSTQCPIAIYSSEKVFDATNSVKGGGNSSILSYRKIMPYNGYVKFSTSNYVYANAFNESFSLIGGIGKWLMDPYEKADKSYSSEINKALPFSNFSAIKNITNAVDLDANDYRKTYPGLGYDIAFDESNGRYVMLQAGYNSTIGYAQIGISYSTDLENWTQDVNNPIFTPTGVDGDPDKGSVTFPQLLRYRDKWLMYYVGYDMTGFEQGVHKICYAESTDFINWVRKGVVLTRENFVNAGVWGAETLGLNKGVIYRPKVINVNGKFYMFINGGPDGDANTGGPNENIYVACSDNPSKGWKVLDMVLDASVVFPSINYKICSDPDVIFDGEDFVMSFWGSGGIYFAKSNIHNFPFNWKISNTTVIGRRPLLIVKGNSLYLFRNNVAATTIALDKADFI